MALQTPQVPVRAIPSGDRMHLAKAADDACALVQDLRTLSRADDPALAELALLELDRAVALMKQLSRLRALCSA